MSISWKPTIIQLTEQAEAREKKIDASFFPPATEANLAAWESRHQHKIPDEIRSFLRQSDGLEAQRGEIWPVLPFAQWVLVDDL